MRLTIGVYLLLAASAGAAPMASNLVTGELRQWPPIKVPVASAPDSAYEKESWVKLDAKAQAAYDAAEKAKAESAAIAAAQAQAALEAKQAKEKSDILAAREAVASEKDEKSWRAAVTKWIELQPEQKGNLP